MKRTTFENIYNSNSFCFPISKMGLTFEEICLQETIVLLLERKSIFLCGTSILHIYIYIYYILSFKIYITPLRVLGSYIIKIRLKVIGLLVVLILQRKMTSLHIQIYFLESKPQIILICESKCKHICMKNKASYRMKLLNGIQMFTK